MLFHKLDPNIIVVFIIAASSIIVSVFSIYMNNRLVSYKVDMLERQVAKHNNIVERTYHLEATTDAVNSKLADISDRISRIEDRCNKENLHD